MEKENIIRLAMILTIVLIAGISIFAYFKMYYHKIPDKMLYFTPQPESWAERDDLSDIPGDVRISLTKATQGSSDFSGNRLEYFEKGSITAFFYHGLYKGEDFDYEYIHPDFYNLSTSKLTPGQIDELRQKYKVIEITQNLKPEDGIMQAFIVAKKDTKGFRFYIYVDEDFKRLLGSSNIVYGEDFLDRDTLIERPFDFSEVSPGIYMDKIEDYNKWYDSEPITGGIAVGDISIDTLLHSNSTFITLR
jgi:hypothetical protein